MPFPILTQYNETQTQCLGNDLRSDQLDAQGKQAKLKRNSKFLETAKRLCKFSIVGSF